ncbi:hypothetical protein KBY97_07785 [Synechococcus sp. ATX 2A4]|uniref:hypothetical protein n=1 Tax=Synechococcus sp. ATX 2A4 TaxID=2823727 RepID=UPI0020CF1A03|nr:hypothetical protein [Synechococcus sp. ATX 2A4]MCP9885028.1 hypothetical protein [Synechococcus sp. ATX 2A4]
MSTAEYGDFSVGNVLCSSMAVMVMAISPNFERVAADIAAGSNKSWEHGSFHCSTTQHCRYRIRLVADVAVMGMERELGLSPSC